MDRPSEVDRWIDAPQSSNYERGEQEHAVAVYLKDLEARVAELEAAVERLRAERDAVAHGLDEGLLKSTGVVIEDRGGGQAIWNDRAFKAETQLRVLNEAIDAARAKEGE